jgi:hypothetical protein
MKFLALSLFFIATQLVSAQYTWFPTGAKWTYDVSWYGGNAFVKLEILPGDTLINNQIHKKMMLLTIVNQWNEEVDTVVEYRYLFVENNRVYDRGQLLYDFTREEGDTLEYMYFGGFSPSLFIVDSVDIIEMNGMSLQFQDIRFTDPFDPDSEWWEMRVIEGIGSINTFFFWQYTVLQPADAAFYYPRCYEDSVIGTIHFPFHSQMDCDALPWTTATTETGTFESSIYPNPASSQIHIQFGGPVYVSISIVDVHGRKILQVNTEGSTEIEPDVSQLPEGIYFVNGITADGEFSYLGKFMKN